MSIQEASRIGITSTIATGERRLSIDQPSSHALLEKIRTIQEPSVRDFLSLFSQSVSEEFLRKGSLREISGQVADRLYIGSTHKRSIESVLTRMKIFDANLDRSDHGNKQRAYFLLPRGEVDGAYAMAGMLYWLFEKYPKLGNDTKEVTIAWREDIPQIRRAFGPTHPWAQLIRDPISKTRQSLPNDSKKKTVDPVRQPEKKTLIESEVQAYRYFRTRDPMEQPPFTDREELDAIQRITIEDLKKPPIRIPSHADTTAGDCTDMALWYGEQILLRGRLVRPKDFPPGTTEFQMYNIRQGCVNYIDRYNAQVEEYNKSQPDEGKKKKPISNLLQFVRLAYWRDQQRKGRITS